MGNRGGRPPNPPRISRLTMAVQGATSIGIAAPALSHLTQTCPPLVPLTLLARAAECALVRADWVQVQRDAGLSELFG